MPATPGCCGRRCDTPTSCDGDELAVAMGDSIGSRCCMKGEKCCMVADAGARHGLLGDACRPSGGGGGCNGDIDGPGMSASMVPLPQRGNVESCSATVSMSGVRRLLQAGAMAMNVKPTPSKSQEMTGHCTCS